MVTVSPQSKFQGCSPEQRPPEEASQPRQSDIPARAGRGLLRKPQNAILVGLILGIEGLELNIFWQNCPPIKST